jgi:hypothetical protein
MGEKIIRIRMSLIIYVRGIMVEWIENRMKGVMLIRMRI